MHTISDFIVFLGWLWANVVGLFEAIFAPVRYIWVYFTQFLSSAFAEPIPVSSDFFNDNFVSMFQGIPYISMIISAVLIGLFVMLGIFLVKQFMRT